MMTPEGATDLVLAAICAALVWRKHQQSPGLAAALAAAESGADVENDGGDSGGGSGVGGARAALAAAAAWVRDNT